MKRRLRQVLSVLVALAMAVTMIPAQSVQAASKPKLNTTKKTLLVGSKTTLKVKNKIAGSTYTWKSSNTDAVTVSKKGVVTAKAGGESIVSCKVKAPSKTYTLKANIKVKDSATVKTQAALDKALANKGITKIKIKTDGSESFTIGAGDYSNKLLIVEAPNADITNNGTFKRIAIRSIKANTWFERAAGNKFSVSASSSRIVVENNASVKSISYTKSGATGTVEAKGNVGKVSVQASVAVTISGSASQNVKVEVNAGAAGAKVTASVPVQIVTVVNVIIELISGAEGSAVEVAQVGVKVEVKNGTSQNVVVTAPNGAQTTVNAGTEAAVGGTTSNGGNDGNSSSGGSSSSGGGGSTTAKSSDATIKAYNFGDQTFEAEGKNITGTYTQEVTSGAAIKVKVTPTSDKAKVKKGTTEGTEWTLTAPDENGIVTDEFTVAAEDGTEVTYTVKITVTVKGATNPPADDDNNDNLPVDPTDVKAPGVSFTSAVSGGSITMTPSSIPDLSVAGGGNINITITSGAAIETESIIMHFDKQDGDESTYEITVNGVKVDIVADEVRIDLPKNQDLFYIEITDVTNNKTYSIKMGINRV